MAGPAGLIPPQQGPPAEAGFSRSRVVLAGRPAVANARISMSSDNASELERLAKYHDAATDSLMALVRLHVLVFSTKKQDWSKLGAVNLYNVYLLRLFQSQKKLEAVPNPGPTIDVVRMARVELGLEPLTIHGMPGVTTHELVLGVPWMLIRWWNRHARPDVYDPPPEDVGSLTLRPPLKELDVAPYLAEVQCGFEDFHPLHFVASLEHEFIKARQLLSSQQSPNVAAGNHGDQHPSWIRSEFSHQQFRLLSKLFGAGDVSAEELASHLDYRNKDTALDNLLRRVTATNDGLMMKADKIGQTLTISRRTRDGVLFFYLHPLGN